MGDILIKLSYKSHITTKTKTFLPKFKHGNYQNKFVKCNRKLSRNESQHVNGDIHNISILGCNLHLDRVAISKCDNK